MNVVTEPGPRRRNCRLITEEPKSFGDHGPIIGYANEPLLSLHDACIPLVGIVHDILNVVSIALKDTPNRPKDDLTRDESASIRIYTMEWTNDHDSLYFLLNQTLKATDRERLKPWFKYLKLFLTALAKIPCAPSQAVWRGVRQNVSDAFPRGTEVIWWSFSSCTTMLTVLENELYLGNMGERTLFSIEVFNARNVSVHSHFSTEDEILLLPGTYMEVRSQLNPTSDLHIIHLRQKMPQNMPLEPPFEGANLYPTIELIGLVSETQPVRPSDGICANATWIQSGVTVAGGNGLGSDFDQLYLNDGLFLDKNDSIYVVDSGNNRIIRWNSGDSSGQVVAGGNGNGSSSSQLNYPIDVFVDDNGTMYISDFYNLRVQQWYKGASSGQTILENLNFIGIGRDDQGSLYTSEWTHDHVKKWQKNDTVGQTLAFGLGRPDRLFVDENRTVYVADRLNHRVMKIVEGSTQGLVVAGRSQGKNDTQLDSPRGVTVDKSGNVYVADTLNHRIMRWLSGATSGTVVVGGRGDGSTSDQLNMPTDLQFDRYGNLYVADSFNGRVQKFTIDTSSC
ncbi:unnamed protein product [Rotaria sordida]|uniref:NAD(P)(+)--arginine ADP-ribosyltransferase n=1 Tax=Rotaria sordida TaxID=392033 RepID=A0A818VSN5_9BILA|nr:unnamed protein product [Rotaria sordida]CAF4009374.1 unnamed protein product [Rotaria sordida]